jgi:hypothetical protein
MKYLLGAATAALLLAGATAASAAQAAATVQASATVIAPLVAARATDVLFGKFVLDSTNAGGTLTLGTDGSRTAGTGINRVGPATGTAGEVDFTNDGSNLYDVQVPAGTTLTDGGSGPTHNMSVTFTTSPGTLTGLSAPTHVLIGGTLTANASQAAGLYMATFNVTGNYE